MAPVILAVALIACAAPAPMPRRLAVPKIPAPCGYPLPSLLPEGQMARAYVRAIEGLALRG